MTERTTKVKSKQFVPRYSRWIRKYTEVLNDPKIGMLSDAQYRIWDSLLLIAGTSPDGVLPDRSVIAYTLRKSEADMDRAIDELIDRGLIDIIRPGVLRPHNWLCRQFTSDGSAQRMKRLRERRRNADEAVSETGSETIRPNGSSDGQCDGQCDVTRDGICSDSVSDSVSVDRYSAYQGKNSTTVKEDTRGLVTRARRGGDAQ